MAKEKSEKPAKKNNSDAPRRVPPIVWLHAGGVVVLLGVLTAGYLALRQYVEKKAAFPSRPPTVLLVNRPGWMTDFLARQIAQSIRPRGAHSAFDHAMLVEVDRMLRQNPWIRSVRQVRRAYGQSPGDTLEIDCEYRDPAALVKSKNAYWLVDAQGVRLPERYEAADVPNLALAKDGRRIFRVIEGVRNPPPPLAGTKWTGDDLTAGLDLARLLDGKSFADAICGVNVDNFNGRVDPIESHLTLVTDFHSPIRWGRPVNAKDAFIEVSAQRKLTYLQKVYEDFGRVDANQPNGIDIRYDKVTYSTLGPNGGARADGGH